MAPATTRPARAAGLTDAAIRQAKPGVHPSRGNTGGKPYQLTDTAGLQLEVLPSGGKLWRFKYRFGAKQKRMALGAYPTVSLKDARERRDDARKQLAAGIDPGAAKQAVKASRAAAAANSFESVAREWIAVQSAAEWVPGYGVKVVGQLERNVFPWIGRKPVAEVSAAEVLECLRRVEGRGAVESARRIQAQVAAVFNFAMATQRATANPASSLRAVLKGHTPKHLAAIIEPRQVGALLRATDDYRGTFTVRCALKLAPLVFVRPGELRQAEWAEFNLDAGEWNIPAAKMKTRHAHLVPLSSQALAVLRELEPLTGSGRYLFPSPRSPARPMSDNAVLSALRRMGFAKDEMSGHGFRAMARTILDEVLGVRPDFIEHQLAHAVRDANGRAYNRTSHLAERRKMMQQWADYLDTLKAGGNVVPMRRSA